jgi:hypothetical protein
MNRRNEVQVSNILNLCNKPINARPQNVASYIAIRQHVSVASGAFVGSLSIRYYLMHEDKECLT